MYMYTLTCRTFLPVLHIFVEAIYVVRHADYSARHRCQLLLRRQLLHLLNATDLTKM